MPKQQDVYLFKSPERLSGRQKEEATLNISKKQIVKKISLSPEGLFDDIFMPKQRGSTFPVELTNLTRQIKELINGATDPDPPVWKNPEEYKCVVVTNDMLKTGRETSGGLYNTVIRNIQAITLFLNTTTAFNEAF